MFVSVNGTVWNEGGDLFKYRYANNEGLLLYKRGPSSM